MLRLIMKETKTILLIAMLSLSTVSFARVHDDCLAPAGDLNRIFAMGFVGGIIESVEAGPSEITVPDGFTFETGFQAVCDELDRHPELWDIPSRDAIIVAVDILWKNKHPIRKHLDEDDTVAGRRAFLFVIKSSSPRDSD